MSYLFHIQTFGCQMNVSDSDWLARVLVTRGFTPASFEEAELYILNTCSVRDKPEKKVYSEIGRIARMAKVQKRAITICVGGCVAQQVGIALSKRFPEVRLIFGTDGITHTPEALSRVMEEPGLRINLLDFADSYEERVDVWKVGAVSAEACVTIMQGCDNFCAYCIVPYVRGRQKSRRAESIIAECRVLLENGARGITLLGQNVNSFGQDKGADGTIFSQLLYRLAELPGLERLHFMTPHPKDIAPDVIAAFGSLEVLSSRIHLPLQSGSDMILNKMGRRYTSNLYCDIVKQLKSVRPDIIFTTDIIVGFPEETEEAFQATLDMMQYVGFATSYSFVYSDRPGAKAALFPGKIERPVALERLSRLQAWQNNATEQLLIKQVGKCMTVLLENRSQRPLGFAEGKSRALLSCSEEQETWQGKTGQGFIVNVSLPVKGEGTWSGAMLPVTIDAAGRYSLKGTQAGTPW